MTNEILRFVNVRKFVGTSQPTEGAVAVRLVDNDKPSPLFTALLKLKEVSAARSLFEQAARAHLTSELYALGSKPLPLSIERLDQWFDSQNGDIDDGSAEQAVQSIFGSTREALLASADYDESLKRLRDTVLAQSIAPNASAEVTTAARWLRLVDWLSASPLRTAKPALLRRVLLLPAALFPLPSTKNPQDDINNQQHEQRKKDYDAAQQAVSELTAGITVKRNAIAELSTALAGDTYQLRKAASTRPVSVALAASTSATTPTAETTPVGVPAPVTATGTAVLTPTTVETLSSSTKSVLSGIRVTDSFVDVNYAVSALEADVAKASTALYSSGRATTNVALIGNQWLPVVDYTGLHGSLGKSWKEPGPCALPPFDLPAGGATTVPATTQSDIRPIGIADLMQIRQTTQRYEMGEIAHVENVMASELRERTHRNATRITQTEFIETERTTEDSRDLQTTDRFELQQEASEIVREESNREVALSISLSYGPFVEGSANVTAGHSDSREQSNRNAVRFSREVTDKAVRKVQERVLARRSTVTETETEETNKHVFDNKDGGEHVRGVYRWLDKIHKAQVVSYGLRMIFDAVVPEPAAFYRFALGAAPKEGVNLKSPNPPGYCVHPAHGFVPLQPNDLNQSNYQFWVSQYGATDVEPPPPLYRTIGIAAAEEATGDDRAFTFTNTELQVPAGYLAERAFVRGSAPISVYDVNKWFTTFHVGRSHLAAGETAAMHGEDGVIPVVGHGYNVHALSFTVEVLCIRSPETYAAWQLATYTKIMASYNDLKSQYEAALSRSQVNQQNNAAVFGKNPEVNRDIERNELKRAFISLLTGQHFDQFDAMRRNVPSYGYPQMDIAEAIAEGRYIQFFEQAVEWSNMSYRFYPYFWGQKAEWPHSFQMDDTDPLFAKFLQAGAARVQIPIRPGFENAMLYLLQTGNKPWEQEEFNYAIQGAAYVSMLDELREEQLGAFTKGVGSVSLQAGSTTVAGAGTAFDAALHTDRDIELLRRRYRVQQVVSATELTLDRPFADSSMSGVEYAFGARLVGDPWEVRVPTHLVMLQENAELPDLSE